MRYVSSASWRQRISVPPQHTINTRHHIRWCHQNWVWTNRNSYADEIYLICHTGTERVKKIHQLPPKHYTNPHNDRIFREWTLIAKDRREWNTRINEYINKVIPSKAAQQNEWFTKLFSWWSLRGTGWNYNNEDNFQQRLLQPKFTFTYDISYTITKHINEEHPATTQNEISSQNNLSSDELYLWLRAAKHHHKYPCRTWSQSQHHMWENCYAFLAIYISDYELLNIITSTHAEPDPNLSIICEKTAMPSLLSIPQK